MPMLIRAQTALLVDHILDELSRHKRSVIDAELRLKVCHFVVCFFLFCFFCVSLCVCCLCVFVCMFVRACVRACMRACVLRA